MSPIVRPAATTQNTPPGNPTLPTAAQLFSSGFTLTRPGHLPRLTLRASRRRPLPAPLSAHSLRRCWSGTGARLTSRRASTGPDPDTVLSRAHSARGDPLRASVTADRSPNRCRFPRVHHRPHRSARPPVAGSLEHFHVAPFVRAPAVAARAARPRQTLVQQLPEQLLPPPAAKPIWCASTSLWAWAYPLCHAARGGQVREISNT